MPSKAEPLPRGDLFVRRHGREAAHSAQRARVTVAPLHVIGFGSAALVTLADQATKELVRVNLDYGEVIPVTGFFNVVYQHHTGAAFGMFLSRGSTLLAFALVAIVVLSVLLIRTEHDRWGAAALAAMLGGAAGNVIDRLRHGAVVDWLDFHAAGWHWPAFNLADAAIVCGVGLLLFDGLFGGEGDGKHKRS